MRLSTRLASLATGLLLSAAALAGPSVGQPAPAFSAIDSNGKTVSLADFKDRPVVLEWSNAGCPFVQKHYGSGNMQSLQKAATAKNVAWLTVISSAPGKQGHVDGAAANKLSVDRGATPTAVLLDESGAVGRLYDAKTTPHMYGQVLGDNGRITTSQGTGRGSNDGGHGGQGGPPLTPVKDGLNDPLIRGVLTIGGTITTNAHYNTQAAFISGTNGAAVSMQNAQRLITVYRSLNLGAGEAEHEIVHAVVVIEEAVANPEQGLRRGRCGCGDARRGEMQHGRQGQTGEFKDFHVTPLSRHCIRDADNPIDRRSKSIPL